MLSVRSIFISLLAAAFVCCACVEDVGVEGTSCDDEHPCPGEEYNCIDEICYEKAPTIAVACSADADCPAGVCLEGAHVCVGCIKHDDCVSGLCHIPTHVCIGCKADYQCPTDNCDESTGMCEESPTEIEPEGN